MFWFYFDTFIWFLLQLPQNLIALIMSPFVGKKKLVFFDNFTWFFACNKMKGSISLGNFAFISTQSNIDTSIKHELEHSLQSKQLMWLYLPIVLIPRLCLTLFGLRNKCFCDWHNKQISLAVLQSNIDIEISRAKTNEARIEGLLNDEIIRSKDAENKLVADIRLEYERAFKAEKDINNRMDDEILKVTTQLESKIAELEEKLNAITIKE